MTVSWPQKRKETTLTTLLAQLDGLAARQPVLMIFEDAHWIDPTSLELLELTVERVPSRAVLLVITFRPEFTAPWVGRPHVTMRPLSRLGRREAMVIVEKVAGDKALPKEVVDHIVGRTDGVPLFVEELTKAVLESELLRGEGDQYVLTAPLPQLAIPTSLHASLMERLDGLSAVREIAEVGTAIGREFSHELICAVATRPGPALEEALNQLVASELVFRRGAPPDAVYTFKHALVQDAAYSTLLRGARQQLHGRIGAVLEERFPGTAEMQPELLARHFTEAGLAERAIPYWVRAGERARERSANVEAVAHFRKGLTLVAALPGERQRVDAEYALQIAIGGPLIAAKGYSSAEVEQTYLRARELCQQLGRSAELFPVLRGL
jgi:predicted ATPase